MQVEQIDSNNLVSNPHVNRSQNLVFLFRGGRLIWTLSLVYGLNTAYPCLFQLKVNAVPSVLQLWDGDRWRRTNWASIQLFGNLWVTSWLLYSLMLSSCNVNIYSLRFVLSHIKWQIATRSHHILARAHDVLPGHSRYPLAKISWCARLCDTKHLVSFSKRSGTFGCLKVTL